MSQIKKLLTSFYEEGFRQVDIREHAYFATTNLDDDDQEDLYAKYEEKYPHIDTQLSKAGMIVRFCHSPEVKEEDIAQILNEIEKGMELK